MEIHIVKMWTTESDSTWKGWKASLGLSGELDSLLGTLHISSPFLIIGILFHFPDQITQAQRFQESLPN